MPKNEKSEDELIAERAISSINSSGMGDIVNAGQADQLIRFLKDCLSNNQLNLLKYLRKCRADVLAALMRHQEFPKVLDAYLILGGLGVIELSNQHLAMFKLLVARAGTAEPVTGAKPSMRVGQIVINPVQQSPVSAEERRWVPQHEFGMTLPAAMREKNG